MTTGIYQLIFTTNDTYIGQARNIEDRYQQHCNNLANNKAAVKMQQAYQGYDPNIYVLLECHEDYLNAMEMYYINVKQPTLNTAIPKFRSNDEMRALADNKPMLLYSPASIIGAYMEQIEATEALEIEKEALSKKYQKVMKDLDNKLLHFRVEAELKDGKDYNATRVLALERQLKDLTLTIDVLYKRTLWQRIFNSPV